MTIFIKEDTIFFSDEAIKALNLKEEDKMFVFKVDGVTKGTVPKGIYIFPTLSKHGARVRLSQKKETKSLGTLYIRDEGIGKRIDSVNKTVDVIIHNFTEERAGFYGTKGLKLLL